MFTSTFYLQLDAQTSCLFTYNTLIKILYMFRAYPTHLQEVHALIVYMQPLVSSLSAGDDVDLLKMSRVCSKHVEDFN